MTDLFYGTVRAEDLELDLRELSARLGDPGLVSLSELSPYVDIVTAAARPVYAMLRTGLSRRGGRLNFADIETECRGLYKLTDGCGSVLMCAMTLGIEVDRAIARGQALSAADGFFINAVSDAMAEAMADRVSFLAKEKYTFVTGRFSPGYGDLPLSVGSDILRLTDAERRLGIKTASSGLMIPKKSITAIIGIKADP